MSWCKKVINAELVLTDKEDYTKQLMLLYLIRHMNQEESETEDDLLYLKVYDITYTKKMTITSIFNHSNAYKFFIAVVRGFSIAKFCFKQFMNVTKLSNFCSSWNNQKHFSDDFKGNVINLANIRSTIWRQFNHFSYS